MPALGSYFGRRAAADDDIGLFLFFDCQPRSRKIRLRAMISRLARAAKGRAVDEAGHAMLDGVSWPPPPAGAGAAGRPKVSRKHA